MKVLVLGAGVIGTATAWYSALSGHEVTVVERREGPGLETSFANGGQISAGHAEPWANPDTPRKILAWLGREDAPLLFRPMADPSQWEWGLRFLYECTAWRTRENISELVKLALYSRTTLKELREGTHIQYDQVLRGILHYFTNHRDFDTAAAHAGQMRAYGLAREVKSVDEAIAIEPALAHARGRLVGATYEPSDESGDAHKFTWNLAQMAEARGVTFRYHHAIHGGDSCHFRHAGFAFDHAHLHA